MLEIEAKTSNSKKAQLKELQRYCQYHKDGNKFIIDKIYKELKEKIDNRRNGNNSIYSDDIQELIIFTLSQHTNEEICWSCSRFLNELAMTNDNYSICRKDIPKFSKTINMEEQYIYDFYNNTHRNLRQKLETALNCLMRYKKLLIWKPVMIVHKELVDIELNEFGTPKLLDGKVCYYKKKVFQKATKEESKMILSTERKTMLDMGYKDNRDIFLSGNYDNFVKKVQNQLKEKGNIYFYYYAYEIIYNYEDIKNHVVGFLGKIYTENRLNNKIIKCLNKGAETRHKNILKKKESNKLINNYTKIRLKENYICNNKILIEKLINIKNKAIK